MILDDNNDDDDLLLIQRSCIVSRSILSLIDLGDPTSTLSFCNGPINSNIIINEEDKKKTTYSFSSSS